MTADETARILAMIDRLANEPPSPAEQRAAAMTLDELWSDKQSTDAYFDDCRECGQGIGTKERVRYHAVCDRLEEMGETVTRWR